MVPPSGDMFLPDKRKYTNFGYVNKITPETYYSSIVENVQNGCMTIPEATTPAGLILMDALPVASHRTNESCWSDENYTLLSDPVKKESNDLESIEYPPNEQSDALLTPYEDHYEIGSAFPWYSLPKSDILELKQEAVYIEVPPVASAEEWNNYWEIKQDEESILLDRQGCISVEVSGTNNTTLKACSVCNSTFTTQEEFCKHAQQAHAKMQYECLNCSTVYSHSSDLQHHLETQCSLVIAKENGASYDVSKDESVPSLEPVNIKIELTPSGRLSEASWDEYWNQKKEQAATALALVNYHAISKTDSEGNELKVCSVCHKNFKFKSRCDKHAIIAHAGIKYPCLSCNKEYYRATSLRLHSLRCLKVGDQLETSNSIEYENVSEGTQRKLINEKISLALAKQNYRCVITNDSFGKEIYECSICCRTFSCKGECNRHARNVHTGVRHSCPFCAKSSSCPGSLRRHIESHHNTKNPRQKCPHCPKSYISAEELNKHIKLQCKYRLGFPCML